MAASAPARPLVASVAAFGWLSGTLDAPAQVQGVAGPVSIEHERFGALVASVPDVNGDAIADVAIAADDIWAGSDWQRVFLYSGQTGGFLRAITGIVTIPNGATETFGVRGLAGLEDVNGDGRGDLAIADPVNRRALLISGANGQLLRTLEPPGTSELQFGASVASIGDLDGDGLGDVIVGAPTPSLTVLDTGAAHVFSGGTGSLIRSLAPLPNPGPVHNGDPLFGWRVLGMPDVNGDARPDIVVAGYRRLMVFSGATGQVIRVTNGFANADGYGHALAWCPDADGDGVADLIVGAPLSSLNAQPPLRGLVAECGRAYLYSGATGSLLRSWRGPAVAGARFGWSVAGVPDLTGDGRGDVVIGSPANPDAIRGAGYGPGRAHIMDGATGLTFRILNSPNAELGGSFGIGVAGLPDTNSTGRGDVFIGAPQEDPASNSVAEMGRAYFVRY